MSEVTDLEISAGIRRELSGRRVDLSKMKFKVTSGEVVLTGELSFVGMEKSPDEIPVEIKFIEGRLKSIRGVKELKFQLENWVHNESGKWELKGGTSKGSGGAAMASGEGIHCSSCSTVIKFCPCCGMPLAGGEAGGKGGLGKSPLRSIPKKPDFSRHPIHRTGTTPLSQIPRLGEVKPLKTEPAKPLAGQFSGDKSALSPVQPPPGSTPPAKPESPIPDSPAKTEITPPSSASPFPPRPTPVMESPISKLPSPMSGPTPHSMESAHPGPGITAKPDLPSVRIPPPSKESTDKVPVPIKSSVPLVAPKPLPLKSPGGFPGQSGRSPIPAPFSAKPPAPPVTPKPPESQPGNDETMQSVQPPKVIPSPLIKPPIPAKPPVPAAAVKTEDKLDDMDFSDILPPPKPKAPPAEPAPKPKPPAPIPDLSLDDEDLLPPLKSATSQVKPPAPKPPEKSPKTMPDLSDLSLDDDTPLPPPKPRTATPPALAKPKETAPIDLGLDEDTPLPPMKKPTAPTPAPARKPAPVLSLDDDDTPLPPMKGGPSAPQAKPPVPDLSLDDDTPLPPMKGKTPAPAVSGAPKPAVKPPAPIQLGDDDDGPLLPPKKPGAPEKPAGKSAKGELDDLLDLDLGIQDLFKGNDAGGKGKPAAQAPQPPKPSTSAPAAPKAKTPGKKDDSLNLDDILDLGDLPPLPGKKSEEKEKDKKGKPDPKSKDPLNLDDFDLSKF